MMLSDKKVYESIHQILVLIACVKGSFNPFKPNGFSIFINWISSFLILGLLGGIVQFYSNCNKLNTL